MPSCSLSILLVGIMLISAQARRGVEKPEGPSALQPTTEYHVDISVYTRHDSLDIVKKQTDNLSSTSSHIKTTK